MGKEILEEKQVRFLKVIKSHPDLTGQVYLTGGTALAAFYLNHRKSEDLDFFSEEEISPLAVETFFKKYKSEIGFKKFEFQKSFNRNLFFLDFDDGSLKTEFTYFPFPPIEKGGKDGELRIDSLKDIAVNKVFTIAQQVRARDFVDVYFIIKRTGWQLQELVKEACLKFDTRIDLIQLGSQLLKVDDLKDMPRMLIPLNFKHLQDFFLKEARALKKEILF